MPKHFLTVLIVVSFVILIALKEFEVGGGVPTTLLAILTVAVFLGAIIRGVLEESADSRRNAELVHAAERQAVGIEATRNRKWFRRFTQTLRKRGFFTNELEASKGKLAVRWDPMPEAPSRDFEVELTWEGDEDPRTVAVSWAVDREGEGVMVVSCGAWRARVDWTELATLGLDAEQRESFAAAHASHGKITSEQAKFVSEPLTAILTTPAHEYVKELLTLKDWLDAWTSRPEEVAMRGFEGIAARSHEDAVAYYRELYAQGHMSAVEVFERASHLPDREHEPYATMLEHPKGSELLDELGVDASIDLYARVHGSTWWDVVTSSLCDAIVEVLEPDTLVLHEGLSAEATWDLMDGWQRRADGDSDAIVEAAFTTCWSARAGSWRAHILHEFAGRHDVRARLPHLIEAAARLGRTGEEHVALSKLLGVTDDDVLELEEVVDALLEQIERSPVGSHNAIVNVIAARDLDGLPRELLSRVRGVDPLSPLAEAAQVLCDPERLRGALTESVAGTEGGLSVSVAARGGVTRVK